MRSFEDLDTFIGSVPFDVVTSLRVVDTGRGSEALFRDKLPALLTSLAARARVASIEASSAIEGVVVADKARAAAILSGDVHGLRDRSEQELAGYREALDYLYQESWRPLNIGLLLHLHRLLFRYTDVPGGGFKSSANLVVDRHPDGSTTTRFTPVAPSETPYYLDELIARYSGAIAADRHHPVLVIGLFVLDLLTIHPFLDGNGRISRAVTNALLQDVGYDVTRYVSFEDRIARTADAYYAGLLSSTHDWHAGRHDPWPWLRYFVAVLNDSYDRFDEITAANRSTGSKQDRVRDYVTNHAASTFRIADIRTALPGVSDQTIRLTLDQLRVAGVVRSDGAGRTATWTRLHGAAT
ncbi:Fic family protein [Rathayibacter sp. PhB151]|uniref:Fic family protein n=1 Tax=Rathayibacter sp. PhB151 TaxID=2485189 RepID=UPI001063C7B8|nr:Fic family protein [Rathayibacter sp. PhB151]TDX81549.1 Fic family protein [Rathayibacter sp. PhB151]